LKLKIPEKTHKNEVETYMTSYNSVGKMDQQSMEKGITQDGLARKHMQDNQLHTCFCWDG
jgi:hypothetical protein